MTPEIEWHGKTYTTEPEDSDGEQIEEVESDQEKETYEEQK